MFIKLIAIFLVSFASFQTIRAEKNVSLGFYWTQINFTWPSADAYNQAIDEKTYIPGNTFLGGFRIYDGNVYLALPRYKEGTPVTLAKVSLDAQKVDPLLTPFPSWDDNVGDDCATLQNVRAVEIDSDGIMWVVDGIRGGKVKSECPAKLVLYDLNKDGEKVMSYDFPEDITSTDNAYLRNIVVDGDCAFISDSEQSNPGLIVYSKESGKSYILHDKDSMGDVSDADVEFDGQKFERPVPIDGLGLTPKNVDDRYVYYTSSAATHIYRIKLDILKDSSNYEDGNDAWKSSIEDMGEKSDPQSAGMLMDNQNRLWFIISPKHEVFLWEVDKEKLEDAKELYSGAGNLDENLWEDSMSFDDAGHLYITSMNRSQEIAPGDGVFYMIKGLVDAGSYIDS